MHDTLRRLGVRRFVLGVHDSMFPPGAWDAGYGAPASPAGRRILAFASRLGFNALQVGPAGQISPINLSPYDGTSFARNVWSLDVGALTGDEYAGLLQPDVVDRLALGHRGAARAQPERVERVMCEVLDACHARFAELRARSPEHALLRDFERFRTEHRWWLERNAVYEALAARVGDDPSCFDPAVEAMFEPGAAGVQRRGALRATLGPAIERAELAQYLCHAQQAQFRAFARAEGIALWGDMQVGFSRRDQFLHRDCFNPRWLVGAPPSRTNPDGQPWGYPLLDPDQLDSATSPARELFEQRLRKLLSEHDGMRIDHPQGLVCPWIYRASDADAFHALLCGARAFDSPDAPDPDLARWAIARHGDLAPAPHSPFADDWVRQLDDAQVARYSRLFDVLVRLCEGRGAARDVFAAEVLSTCPYPLARVLLRHGFGRFRVTQKADMTNAADVYRTDQALPNDWLTLGTHDSAPVLVAARGWLHDGSAPLRAAYLAERLIEDPARRRAAAARIASSERELVCASLADLFGSRAENVHVFVGDLFGETHPFNRPGVVHPDNWTARLPEDFEEVYAERLREGRALDIASALRLALTRTLPVPG